MMIPIAVQYNAFWRSFENELTKKIKVVTRTNDTGGRNASYVTRSCLQD